MALGKKMGVWYYRE